MRLLKQRAPGPRWLNCGAHLGIGDLAYIGLARFASKAESLGLKPVSIGRTFGGCRLAMKSGAGQDYEVLINSIGNALLGRIDGDKRVRLAQGSSETQAGWDMLLSVLGKLEGRQP